MTALGLPYPTIIGTVHGGDWASTVIDRIVAEGRYGVRLGQTSRGRRGASCAPDRRGLRRRSVPARAPGERGDRRRPLLVGPGPGRPPAAGGLADAAEAVIGRRPALLGEPYGADMRLLVNEGRTPTVIFGPGDVRVAHAPTSTSRSTRSWPAPASSRHGSWRSSAEGTGPLMDLLAAELSAD